MTNHAKTLYNQLSTLVQALFFAKLRTFILVLAIFLILLIIISFPYFITKLYLLVSVYRLAN